MIIFLFYVIKLLIRLVGTNMALSVESRENLDTTTHNLNFDQVLLLIEQNYDTEYTLISIKPIQNKLQRSDYIDLIISMLDVMGLSLLCTAEKMLSDEEIIRLYNDIFQKKVEKTTENTEIFLNQLLLYMKSGPVLSFLISGLNARNIASEFKMTFRDFFCESEAEINLRNIIHTPENEEISSNVEILFKI